MNRICMLVLCVVVLATSSTKYAWGMSIEEFMETSSRWLDEPDKSERLMQLADAALAHEASGDAVYAGVVYFVKSSVYARQGNFAAAHREADRALRRAPGKFAYMAKSAAYEREGKPEEAWNVCRAGAAALHDDGMAVMCDTRFQSVQQPTGQAGQDTPD